MNSKFMLAFILLGLAFVAAGTLFFAVLLIKSIKDKKVNKSYVMPVVTGVVFFIGLALLMATYTSYRIGGY